MHPCSNRMHFALRGAVILIASGPEWTRLCASIERCIFGSTSISLSDGGTSWCRVMEKYVAMTHSISWVSCLVDSTTCWLSTFSSIDYLDESPSANQHHSTPHHPYGLPALPGLESCDDGEVLGRLYWCEGVGSKDNGMKVLHFNLEWDLLIALRSGR